MNDPFYLECEWGARLESAQSCAERCSAMLAGLAAAHPAFTRWCKQGDFRADADHPFCTMPPSVEELTEIFERHPFTRGAPKAGFFLSAWNGQESSHAVALIVQAGSDLQTGLFPNHIEFSFRSSSPANADFILADVLKEALLISAAAWNPDYASLYPWAYSRRWGRAEPWNDEQREVKRMDEQTSHPVRRVHIPRIRTGWMTYLCPDYARRIIRPSGVEVEPVSGGGALLIATREVFTPGNPAHDAAADAIQEALLPLQNLPCEAKRK